jgi:glycosyltransferase involved in cell wall biosynthesis
LKLLFISNLFPNRTEPTRGIFNLHQIRHLAKFCEVQVVAPIAWFPIPGKYAPPAPVPAYEEVYGLESKVHSLPIPVHHPRNFYLPKIGRPLNAWLYALSLQKKVAALRRKFSFDVIFVNWAFPDACGTAHIARQLGVPFVASISGSDVNLYLTFHFRRRQILRMLDQAAAVTTRSQALKNLLVFHGVPADKIHVLYNGVDRDLFQPTPQAEARRLLKLPKQEKVLLYVGRLSPEKGLADMLTALGQLPHRPRVVIVGDGHQREELQAQARQANLEITWVGTKQPAAVPLYLSAADLLCLPSHMEGVPNAALEAFACGLPVVASRVGGLPEVVTDDTGILVEPKNPVALAGALRVALERPWNRDAILAHAAKFDWNANAHQLLSILESAAPSIP